MPTVIIEREGYKVEAIVAPGDPGPGLSNALEIREILQSWVTDREHFYASFGGSSLEDVMQMEAEEIGDELIDAAQLAIDDGLDDFDDGGWL